MISASALAPHCGYARVLNAKRPKPPTTIEAADRGTMFHAAVELWIKGGRLPEVGDLEIQGWLDLLASQWGPPTNVAVETEVAWGLRPDGSYVDVDEPEPHHYVARGGGELLTAGRADLAWTLNRNVVVIDWKTGKWPAAPASINLQVNAAGIALARRAGAVSYSPTIYYARDGAWDHVDEPIVLADRLGQLMFAAVQHAATLPPEPRPGDWCDRCWERKACPRGPS